MLGKKPRLRLERLEAREVPAAISTLAAAPILAVTVAPIAPATVTNPNSVAIGIQLINTTLSPSSNTGTNTTPLMGPLQPYQFYRYDPSYYAWMITPIA